MPTESPSDTAHTDGHEEDKEQPVSNASSCEHAVPREPHERSSIRAAQAPQDVHLPTKLSCQKSPVRAEEPSQRQTVGIKRPSKPPVHEEPKGGLKVESEPAPYEIGEQSSRDKPKPKTKSRSKSCDQKELKPRPSAFILKIATTTVLWRVLAVQRKKISQIPLGLEGDVFAGNSVPHWLQQLLV